MIRFRFPQWLARSARWVLFFPVVAMAALPNGSQPVLTSTYTADAVAGGSPTGVTWSNTNFTISCSTTVSSTTSARDITIEDAAPSGAFFHTNSYSNSTTPVFHITVTAKAPVLASFNLSSITLKGYDPTDSWSNVQISATLAAGGTITNTAQSFSGNSADYVPNLTTGSFSTSADITSFTISFQLASTSSPANTDMTLNAFSVSNAKPPPPSASTTAASAIATRSATLGGTATADAGGAAITARGIVYSTTNTTPTIGGAGVTNVTIGSGTGSFNQSVTGLTAGTLHYFRAYATNSGGTGYGSVLTFTTGTDQDGTVTAGTGVTEPVVLPTTATTAGGAVDLFDFKITDGGTSDAAPLTISQVVVSTSGTGPFSKVTWLLNGPDASNVTGVYSSGTNTITFSGLGISVANGGNETYTVRGYYNDNTNLTENQTFILSVTGGTSSFTVGSSGTRMVASQSAVNNGTGTKIGVTATKLLFATQPAGSTSGAALTTQPVVRATDAASNIDVDFTGNVTLAVGSGAGSLSGTVTKPGVSGVATFTDVAYSATADQQAFTLATSNASGLTNATSNSVTSDVVATALQFSTQPAPTSIQSGTATAFSTVPVVRAVNAGGVVDTAARNITLTVTNTSGGAAAGTVNALGGVSGDTDASATIVTIPASSGVATFTGLSVTYTNDASATNSIALHAAAGGLTAANSSTLTSAVPPVINSTLSASGTYGTAISTYTITATNSPTSYSATGLPSGLSVNTANGQITGTPTTNGSFNVTIGATNAGGTGTATLVFTVAKAVLTVTADNASRAYGAANPTFTATITGFAFSDTTAVLTGAPALSTTATTSSVPGTYAITAALGTLAATNYSFSFAAGTLTITDDPRVSWRVANFGTVDNTGTAADTADPDGDGLVNLMEYALNSTPLTPSADALPVLSTTTDTGSTYLTLTLTRNSAATDLTFVVEASDDLSNSGAWTTSGLVTLVNTSTSLSVRDSTPIGSPPRFLRLRVASGVTTPPMGGLQFSLAAGAGSSSPANTNASLPFTRAIAWTSAATSVTSQTITVNSAGWTAGRFSSAAHYVELLDGPLAGLTIDISSHTSDTLTLAAASLSGYSAGMRFTIRPHATLASAFGATNPTSLAAAVSIVEADEVRFYDPVAQTTNRYYYKSGGLGGTGWRSTTSTSINRAATVIRPEWGFIIARKSSDARVLITLGEARTAAVVYPIEPGYNYLSVTQPVPVTLSQFGLITGNASTGMVGDTAISTADELQRWTGAAWERLYYDTNAGGWRSSTDASTNRGSQTFATGEMIAIQRKRTGEALFTRPAAP